MVVSVARRRDRSYLSRPALLSTVLSGPPSFPPPVLLNELRALDTARAVIRATEDRRRFHPMRDLRPAGSLTRNSRRMQISTGKLARGFYPPSGISFSNPSLVAICVRRKTRREVIFAKRKARKGAVSRNRRRSYYSNVGC